MRVPHGSRDIGVRRGDVLAGKYRVDRVLGAGGMGVIVAAHHIQLDQAVALKFLLPDAQNDSEATGRFVREAQAAVRIKSEHVARVMDVGRLENGLPFMVMEYLDGADLSSWLMARGAIPPEQAVEFVLQVCEAMAEAHALGIVHRDLKPANLFVIRRPDGRLSVKVLDFGISKVTSVPGTTTAASMTRSNAVLGSPLYMSPEQMQAFKQVDARTDIWSLGVILFELLAGTVPFEGEAVTELAIKIATTEPRRLRELRQDVPVELEQVVMRCLEKDRDRRFQDVAELALALQSFGPKRAAASIEKILGIVQAAGLPSGESFTTTADAQPAPPLGTPARTLSTWARTRVWTPKSRKDVWIGASVAAGLAAGIVAIVLVAGTGSHPSVRPVMASPSAELPPQRPAATFSTASPASTAEVDAATAIAPTTATGSSPAATRVVPVRPVANNPSRAVPLSPASSPARPTKHYNPLEHL